jgi:hypothetical protein
MADDSETEHEDHTAKVKDYQRGENPFNLGHILEPGPESESSKKKRTKSGQSSKAGAGSGSRGKK